MVFNEFSPRRRCELLSAASILRTFFSKRFRAVMCYAILRVNDSGLSYTSYAFTQYLLITISLLQNIKMIHFSNIPASAKWNRNRSAFRDFYLAGFYSPKSRVSSNFLFLMGFKSTNDLSDRRAPRSERRRVQREMENCTKKENRLKKRKKVIQPASCSQLHREELLEYVWSWRWWRDTTKLEEYVFFPP